MQTQNKRPAFSFSINTNNNNNAPRTPSEFKERKKQPIIVIDVFDDNDDYEDYPQQDTYEDGMVPIPTDEELFLYEKMQRRYQPREYVTRMDETEAQIPASLKVKIDSINDASAKALITKVVTDPRRKFISTTGKGFIYRDDRNNVVTLRGITAGLAEVFWPDFDFSKLKRTKKVVSDPLGVVGGKVEKRGGKKKKKLSHLARLEDFATIHSYKNNQKNTDIVGDRFKKNKSDKTFMKNGQFKSKLMGLERGKRLHQQIDDVVTFGLGVYLSTKGSLDDSVKNLFNMMDKEWQWVPLLGETPVYDLRSKKVTAVDIIVYDKVFKRIVLVEVKTGYDGCFEVGEKNMQKKVGLTNSPLNQAKMQLIATTHMFLKMFDTGVSVKCCIVWMDSGANVRRFWVDADVYETAKKKLNKYFFVKPKEGVQQNPNQAINLPKRK